jgi:uncharacterized phage-like protein YoqJ
MILAGTGHRPDKLGGYGQDIAQRMVQLATECLEEHKPDVIISGMALGWDQALAGAAIKLDLEWWACIPFKGQELLWPQKSQSLYRRLLEHAHVVSIICDGGYAAHKMQLRNVAMVDKCNKVLALWNGTPGGTANCVAYAHSVGKPIINVWNKWNLH